jgi:hypothetical protein
MKTMTEIIEYWDRRYVEEMRYFDKLFQDAFNKALPPTDEPSNQPV